MKLFAPLSEAEADEAERGVLRGDFVWFDTQRPQAAPVDAVWVAIEMPDNRVPRFERRLEPGLAHREFLLPARITNLHQPRRVPLPL
jgi:hypothetical protein